VPSLSSLDTGTLAEFGAFANNKGAPLEHGTPVTNVKGAPLEHGTPVTRLTTLCHLRREKWHPRDPGSRGQAKGEVRASTDEVDEEDDDCECNSLVDLAACDGRGLCTHKVDEAIKDGRNRNRERKPASARRFAPESSVKTRAKEHIESRTCGVTSRHCCPPLIFADAMTTCWPDDARFRRVWVGDLLGSKQP
jgi:hypothetical protein